MSSLNWSVRVAPAPLNLSAKRETRQWLGEEMGGETLGSWGWLPAPLGFDTAVMPGLPQAAAEHGGSHQWGGSIRQKHQQLLVCRLGKEAGGWASSPMPRVRKGVGPERKCPTGHKGHPLHKLLPGRGDWGAQWCPTPRGRT